MKMRSRKSKIKFASFQLEPRVEPRDQVFYSEEMYAKFFLFRFNRKDLVKVVLLQGKYRGVEARDDIVVEAWSKVDSCTRYRLPRPARKQNFYHYCRHLQYHHHHHHTPRSLHDHYLTGSSGP